MAACRLMRNCEFPYRCAKGYLRHIVTIVALLVVFKLHLCPAQGNTSITEVEVIVTDGLELLEVIRNFSENVHLTVRVRAKQPGGIVFLNTSGVELPLPPLAAPNGLQNGKIMVQPDDPNVDTAYCDLGNRAYILPQLQGSSQAFLTNATLVGYCFYPYQLRANPNVWIIQSLSAIFWSMTPYSNEANIGRRFNTFNNTVYSTTGELAMNMYIFVMLELEDVPEIKPYSQIWLNNFLVVHPQHQVLEVTPWSVSYHALYPSVAVQNFTLTDLDKPDGAIKKGVIGMPELRYCWDEYGSGPFVDPSVIPLNTSVSPIWYVTNSEELHWGLANASAYLSTPNHVDWPMVVTVLGNVSLADAVSRIQAVSNDTRPTYWLPGITSLLGPFNHVPAYAKTVILDMTGVSEPVFELGPHPNGTALVLYSLVLNGLAVRNLTDSPWAPEGLSTPYLSALPLWGLASTAKAPDSYIRLKKVTIRLPQQDYVAMLAAALREGEWQTGAVETAPLLQGFSKLVVPPSTMASLKATWPQQMPNSLRLSQLHGWGIDGSELTLLPEQPLPVGHTLPDITAPEAEGGGSGSDGGLDKGVRIGVGVGVGVGGGLVVIALIIGAVYYAKTEKVLSQYGDTPKGNGSSYSTGSLVVSILGSESNGVADVLPKGKEALQSYLAVNLQAGKLTLESAVEVMALGSGLGRGNRSTVSNTGSGFSQPAALSEKDVRNAVSVAADILNAGQADKLTLTGVLGRGTYGVVYEGTWRNLRVAVKTIIFSAAPMTKGLTGEVDDAGTQVRMSGYERAVKEAAVCTAMSHRNVVATYRYEIKPLATRQEAGQLLEVDTNPEQASDFKLYIIQERCDANLAEAIDYQIIGSLPGSSKLAIHVYLLLDLSKGVEYLHTQSIIHSDLKTDNVLLKLDKSSKLGVTLKVTDFGLAMNLDPGATHVSNFRGGTRFFIAPEVLSEGRAGRSADIYSLGVCAWCVLHGHHPYVADKAGEFLLHPDFPKPPADLQGQDSPMARAVVDLLHRCLLRDPHQRPTAQEVVQILEGLVAALSD